MNSSIPVWQVVGYSNSGKTTCVTTIIQHLTTKHSLQVGTIKHNHKGFQMDQEGKDTWKHRQAGSALTLIQSPDGIGLTMKTELELPLTELVSFVQKLGKFDLILIEGYKRWAYPKIVLIRQEEDLSLINELKNIALLLFWQSQDQQTYRQGCQSGKYPLFPTFLLAEQQGFLNWFEGNWYNESKGD